jgi:hypothetical protein
MHFDTDFAEHSFPGPSVLQFVFRPAPGCRRAGRYFTAHRLTDLSFSKRVA